MPTKPIAHKTENGIELKQCCFCKEYKSLDQFSANNSAKDKKQTHCKTCIKQLKQSKYKDRYRDHDTAWRKSEHGQAVQRAYELTDGRKQIKKRVTAKHNATYPDRHAARNALTCAVRKGILPRIKTLKCVQCGQPARNYHHYLGYSIEHALDVIPLCLKCHHAIG